MIRTFKNTFLNFKNAFVKFYNLHLNDQNRQQTNRKP